MDMIQRVIFVYHLLLFELESATITPVVAPIESLP